MNKEIKDIVIKGRTIPKEIVELIIKRVEAMPPNMKLAVLGQVLTKEDMVKAIEEGSPLGQEILEMELDYYEDLLRD